MKNKFYKSKVCFFSSMLAFAISPAYADSACDVEAEVIQAAVDAPAAGISAVNLEQANILFDRLSGACASGTALRNLTPLVEQIRTLLDMGEAS